MNRKRTKKGFTLIEIMIVVLIIGVLMAIAVPNFIKARAGSRFQTVKANIKQIEAAKSQFAMEQGLGEGGAVAQDDLDPKYIKWPTGPLSGVAYGTGGTVSGAVTYDGNDEAWWDTKCGPAAAAGDCPL